MPRREVVWHYTDQEQEQVDRLRGIMGELENVEILKAKRNALIGEMLDSGFSTRQIAEITGIHYVTVSKMRNRPEEGVQEGWREGSSDAQPWGGEKDQG